MLIFVCVINILIFISNNMEKEVLQKVGQGAYEGQWKDDKQHGHGKEKWPDKAEYEGFWREEKRHGCREVWKQIFNLNKRKLA